MAITISMTAATGIGKTVQDIIEDALKIISVIPDGGAPPAEQLEQLATGLARFNSMVQSLFVESNNTWLRDTSSTSAVAAQTFYAESDFDIRRINRVLNVHRRDSDGIDTPLVKISKQEYFDLSDKSAEGVPTSFYYEVRQAGSSRLYVWPVPASADLPLTLRADYIREFPDAQLSDNFEPPPAWVEAVTYGLAVRLAINYGIPVSPELAATAAKALNVAQGQDYEDASIYPVPSLRGRR